MSITSFGKLITDARFQQTLMLSLVILGAFVPMSIKLRPSEFVQGTYAVIDALKPGDNVILPSTMAGWAYQEILFGSKPIIAHLLEKDVNILWISNSADTVPNDEFQLNELYGTPYWKNPNYGTKFVYCGYAAINWISFADNIRATVSRDVRGTSFDQLPMTKNIKTAADFKAVMGRVTGDTIKTIASSWNVKYGVKVVECESSGAISAFIDVYRGGMLQGIIAGVRGGAEYEALRGQLGAATRFQTSIVYVVLMVIGGIIINNIYRVGIKKYKPRVLPVEKEAGAA